MTRRDPTVALHDMLDYARRAVAFSHGRTRVDLDTDELFGLAMARLVEIVGEAATRVPAEARARLPGVAWPQIIGMRNRLIHAYQAVDHDIVWQTVTHDLPLLIAELERARGEESGDTPHEDAP